MADDFDALVCPFCGETDFDAHGLKSHLLNKGWCPKFGDVTWQPSIWQEPEASSPAATEAGARRGETGGCVWQGQRCDRHEWYLSNGAFFCRHCGAASASTLPVRPEPSRGETNLLDLLRRGNEVIDALVEADTRTTLEQAVMSALRVFPEILAALGARPEPGEGGRR